MNNSDSRGLWCCRCHDLPSTTQISKWTVSPLVKAKYSGGSFKRVTRSCAHISATYGRTCSRDWTEISVRNTEKHRIYIRAKYIEFPHDLEKASAKNFTPLSYQQYFSLRVFSACEGDIKLSFSKETIAWRPGNPFSEYCLSQPPARKYHLSLSSSSYCSLSFAVANLKPLNMPIVLV